MAKWYKDLKTDYRVLLVESSDHVLGSFDGSLSSYVERTLKDRKVQILTQKTVKEVKDVSVLLSKISIEILRYFFNGKYTRYFLDSGEEIPFGVCVWSTGNSALDFVKRIELPLNKQVYLLYN